MQLGVCLAYAFQVLLTTFYSTNGLLKVGLCVLPGTPLARSCQVVWTIHAWLSRAPRES